MGMKRHAPPGALDRLLVLCATPILPQGLRKFTLVEVASGHDMMV
jgi:hypothetical protein